MHNNSELSAQSVVLAHSRSIESALQYWSNGLLGDMVFSGTSLKKAGPQDVDRLDAAGQLSEKGAYVMRAWDKAKATGEYRYEANGKGLIIRMREVSPDGELQKRDLNIDNIQSGTLSPPAWMTRTEEAPGDVHRTYNLPGDLKLLREFVLDPTGKNKAPVPPEESETPVPAEKPEAPAVVQPAEAFPAEDSGVHEGDAPVADAPQGEPSVVPEAGKKKTKKGPPPLSEIYQGRETTDEGMYGAKYHHANLSSKLPGTDGVVFKGKVVSGRNTGMPVLAVGRGWFKDSTGGKYRRYVKDKSSPKLPTHGEHPAVTLLKEGGFEEDMHPLDLANFEGAAYALGADAKWRQLATYADGKETLGTALLDDPSPWGPLAGHEKEIKRDGWVAKELAPLFPGTPYKALKEDEGSGEPLQPEPLEAKPGVVQKEHEVLLSKTAELKTVLDTLPLEIPVHYRKGKGVMPGKLRVAESLALGLSVGRQETEFLLGRFDGRGNGDKELAPLLGKYAASTMQEILKADGNNIHLMNLIVNIVVDYTQFLQKAGRDLGAKYVHDIAESLTEHIGLIRKTLGTEKSSTLFSEDKELGIHNEHKDDVEARVARSLELLHTKLPFVKGFAELASEAGAASTHESKVTVLGKYLGHIAYVLKMAPHAVKNIEDSPWDAAMKTYRGIHYVYSSIYEALRPWTLSGVDEPEMELPEGTPRIVFASSPRVPPAGSKFTGTGVDEDGEDYSFEGAVLGGHRVNHMGTMYWDVKNEEGAALWVAAASLEGLVTGEGGFHLKLVAETEPSIDTATTVHGVSANTTELERNLRTLDAALTIVDHVGTGEPDYIFPTSREVQGLKFLGSLLKSWESDWGGLGNDPTRLLKLISENAIEGGRSWSTATRGYFLQLLRGTTKDLVERVSLPTAALRTLSGDHNVEHSHQTAVLRQGQGGPSVSYFSSAQAHAAHDFCNRALKDIASLVRSMTKRAASESKLARHYLSQVSPQRKEDTREVLSSLAKKRRDRLYSIA